MLNVAGQSTQTSSKTSYLISPSVVSITSETVAGEWWGQQVLDIADLHDKELEFEVMITHLKLRELSSAVSHY